MVSNPDVLFITFPEDNCGYDLITCLNCGKVYAVNIAKQVYVGPQLSEKIKEIKCKVCNHYLSDNYALYPDKYVINGHIFLYKRPLQILPDSTSVVMEFDEIYG